MKRSLSCNDIDKITENIFTKYPPPCYGELLNDRKYTSKKMRNFFLKRFYTYVKK